MMSDGMLSQDEIDALLKIGAEEEIQQNSSSTEKEVNYSSYLSMIEIDTLGEIGNISFGSSATTLSTILNQKVQITTPEVSIIERNKIDESFQFDHVSVQVNYIEGFTGKNILIIKKEDAAVIADIMLGGSGEGPFGELNEIQLSAVQEAMNQMMGTAATSMSTVFEKRVDISPPSLTEVKLADKLQKDNDDICVRVSFQLKVGSLVDSNIMQIMPITFAKQLVEDLMKHKEIKNTQLAVSAEPVDQYSHYQNQQQKKQTDHITNHISGVNNMNHPQMLGNPLIQNKANVQQAEFSSFEQQQTVVKQPRNLDMLLDIPLKVTVQLGRTKRSVGEILDLSSGSIIELDKLAGEPVDILVNEKLIAQGEVVVIDENFGVRVTDIISQSDRLMKLK
ncbi:flagellar motor switch phosphatase FliY [Ornithinibacillus halotolerans]|uniref:Flagellar motor switch phosphatase FliY n=1 Tax=Ornithinibacillus halotolerans TaxID=1274357 RepID=A0A916RMS2_9BACI|nr:flagellar motor switch phosphatase FliY [Ornithinibacillus halotolerans]GGA62996.1 flagellar motor switch phosphatase FliY [Ornithinibacillus halotolerans]